VKQDFATGLAYDLQKRFDLSYRTRVRLAATVTKMVDWGLSEKQAKEALEEIFENLAFINQAPVILAGKGLTTVPIVIPVRKGNR